MGKEQPEPPQPLKRIVWIVSAKDDLSRMPQEVRAEVGFALEQVQRGATPPGASPLHGNLRGVWEIKADDVDGATYRTTYVVEYEEAIYVLDTFKKKAKKGIATSQKDLDRIEKRLKAAREQHEKSKKERKD